MACPLIANLDTVRLTRLDSCGRLVCGADNGIAFDCIASLGVNVDSDDGADVECKAANGRVCGYKKGCPTFRGYGLELNFFSVSSEIIEIATGNPLVLGYNGRPNGWGDVSISCDTGFALEGRTEVVGEEVCVTNGLAAGAWVHFPLPWITNGSFANGFVGRRIRAEFPRPVRT
ncbi:hypothetical protein ACFXAW_32875 [Streptomyces sp. NPDC059445]|uniref:hypothetical protein n=1 Tax=Streptomyces sp. NPDC059445 TaxID=3346832 RepID=UPI00369F2804